MTDPFDRLRQPVEPLAPPSGTFDLLRARARRRRTARAAAMVALATVIIAGAGGLAFTAGRPASSGRLEGPAGGGTPPPSVSTTPTGQRPSPPAASTRPTPRSTPPAPAVSLPHGPVPPGFLPYSVTSVGAGVTYLLGNAPCRAAPCTSVVRSTDGGRSWVGVPAPKSPLPRWQDGRLSPAATVRDLRFASVRDGWAYGGALYSTHDAGGAWRAVDIGGSVLDLATDGTTTYAVVATCDVRGYSCTNARLRSTPASRDQWREIPGVAGGSGGGISLSGRTGVLLLTGGAQPDRLWVRAGSHWQPAAVPACPNGVSAVVTSASSPRLFASCGEGAAGSVYLTTYISDDAGRSWHRQAGPGLQLPNGQVSVAAPAADVVLAASGTPDAGGRLARSVDGGATWADAALPQLPNGWRYVGARSAASAVALPYKPDGSVWTSQDGGLHWAAYRFR